MPFGRFIGNFFGATLVESPQLNLALGGASSRIEVLVYAEIRAAFACLAVRGPRSHHAQGPARKADLVLLVAVLPPTHPPVGRAIAVGKERVLAVGTTVEVRRLVGPRTLFTTLRSRRCAGVQRRAHASVSGVRAPYGSGLDRSPTLLSQNWSTLLAPPVELRGSWLVAGVGLSVFSSATPLRHILDEAAPDHLVLVYVGGTGHGYGLNPAALTSLGFGDTTPDPAGGWFERDSSGRLTGVLQEYAGWTVFARLNRSLPDSLHVAAVKNAVAEALAFGITSIQHMANVAPPEAALRSIRDAAPSIRYRVIRMPIPAAGGGPREWLAAGAVALPGTVRLAGWKWILDGTPIERLAVMRRPYADRPGWYGRLDFPVDTIRRFLRDALRSSGADNQLMLHVAGDSTAALVLNLMTELAPDSVWRSRRVRFEHGDGLMPDLRPLARRLGVIVVQNPAHFGLGGLVAARLGDTRPRVSGSALACRCWYTAGDWIGRSDQSLPQYLAGLNAPQSVGSVVAGTGRHRVHARLGVRGVRGRREGTPRPRPTG